MAVPELLPLSAYEAVRNATIPRAAALAALFFFVAMTVTTTHDSLAVDLVINALGALLFWFLFAAGMRAMLARMTRQLYDGTSPWMPPPPPGEYQVRVASSLMRGRIAVGGHLYVGREKWVFVPHTKNLPQHRSIQHWERPDRISLSTEPVHSAWLQLVLGKLPDRLVVSDGGLRDLLVVPEADHVRQELQRYL